jgi:hypothetical protein
MFFSKSQSLFIPGLTAFPAPDTGRVIFALPQ